VFGVAGLLLALALFHPYVVVASLACSYGAAFLALIGIELGDPEDRVIDWASLRWRAALCACVAVALPAACAISTSATLYLALALALTAPPIVARARRAGRMDVPRPAPSGAARVTRMLEQGPTPGLIASMDTATLCVAWERSFPMLSAASTVGERLLVAHLRQLYLDELDRRHPTSFATWLSTHPAAWSGPERFLPEA
jgi:hypothetical protein